MLHTEQATLVVPGFAGPSPVNDLMTQRVKYHILTVLSSIKSFSGSCLEISSELNIA